MFPQSSYEAKKTIKTLGLTYKKIDACNNDCRLYTGDAVGDDKCKVCNTARYKEPKLENGKRKLIPNKVFRYFPLIPRLKRLYGSRHSAESMVWHATEKNSDTLVRHPRDFEAWTNFDSKYPAFASEPRNARLSLASDGFNPHGNMSTSYSVWPIVLIPCNIPPWMCVKQTVLILSSFIPGPKMLGNDLDVYLQPLVEELLALWQGVETYDAWKKQTFIMRAALMWTISDFPGLCNLSGWNTYGNGLACPTCNFDSERVKLSKGGKWCFIGSRRFLPNGHRFCLQKARFNGKVEMREPPKILIGSEILEQLGNVTVPIGKGTSNVATTSKGKSQEQTYANWKKKSIFFKLPYWKSNLLRHNIDVMHIEKNVCDNLLYTLLNDNVKSKDNLKARQDLKLMKIRKELWPMADGKTCPAASFTFGKPKIKIMLPTLKGIRFPNGYANNISRCLDVDHHRIFRLKSHDSHILLHDLLPIAIRNVLPVPVAKVLVEFCSCFKLLGSRLHSLVELEKLQERLVL